jgi:accessory gene regulator protein AgrB
MRLAKAIGCTLACFVFAILLLWLVFALEANMYLAVIALAAIFVALTGFFHRIIE